MSLLLVITLLFSCEHGGINANYFPENNDPILSEHARIILPLIDAIEEYKTEFEKIPISIDDLNEISDINMSIVYNPIDDENYIIIIRLGWDPSLIYKSSGQKWIFDPGDGKNEIPVKLDLPQKYLPH